MSIRRRSVYTGAGKKGWRLSGINWISPVLFLFVIVKLLALFKR